MLLPGLLTREEAAAFLRCHPRTVDNYRKTGLRAIKVRGRVFFKDADLLHFLEACFETTAGGCRTHA